MNLNEFKVGDRVKINEINDERLRRRLLCFGCHKDCQMEITDTTPLGDPMVVCVKGTNIAIRKSDAEKVRCEPWEK